MASKNFTVTFNIIGNENLSAAVASANKALGNLGKSNKTLQNAAKNLSAMQRAVNGLSNIQNAVKEYKALQAAMNQSAKNLSAAGSLSSLNEAHNRNLKTVERLSGEYNKMRSAQSEAKLEKEAQRERLRVLRAQQQELRRAFNSAKKSGDLNEMRALTAQIKTQSEQIINRNAQVKAASQTYNELTGKVKAARQELSSAQNAAKQSGQNLSLQRSQVQTNLSNLQQQAAALSRLKSALATAGFDVSKLAQEEARLQSEINRANNALSQQESRARALGKFSQAQQNLSNAYSNFQDAMQLGRTIMSPFASAVDNAINFEYAMSKVKALTQMRNIKSGNLSRVREEMAALETQAKELGATTEFTQTEIANAMGFYGMAGWDTSRIQAIMRSTIDLASIAGDHNIARTADVLSDDLSAMGLKAGRMMRLTSGKLVEESKYFTDAFAYAITQANLNRESLHEALKYNAPTAHASGLSLGETFAMNMIVANAGIKGSQAGTSFRQGWVRFLAPPKTAVKALQEMSKEMGVVMEQSEAMKQSMESQATLKSIGVDENASLFDKITKAYEFYQSLEQSQRAGWLKGLVGQYALSAWQNVFDKGNIEEVARIAQEIDSGYSEGWAEQTAGVMRDNTKTDIELLKSSWDALSQSTGAAFLPAVQSAAQSLTSLVTSLNEFVQQNQTAVQWAGLLAAAISAVAVAGAGLAVLGGVISFIGSGLALLAPVVSAIGAGLAALASPVFLTIAAFWALIGVIVLVATHAEQIGQALSDAWNHPQGAVTGFCELVKSSIGSAVQYVVDKWNTLKSALSHPIDAIINFMDHGDVVGGKVKGYQGGMELSQIYNGGGGIGALNAQIDASQAQEQLSAAGLAAQDATVGLQGLSDNLQGISDSAQNISLVTESFDQVNQSAQTNSQEMLTAAQNAQSSGLNFQEAGVTAQNSIVGFQAMVDGASAVAGALSAKAAEIGNIVIPQPKLEVTYLHATVGENPQKHNARGGIYSRGAFTTWFAESSPEAAIPIDGSARAKSLWLQTGDMLGMLDSEPFQGNSFSQADNSSVNINITINVAGNADDKSVRQAVEYSLPEIKSSLAEQIAYLRHERSRRSYA